MVTEIKLEDQEYLRDLHSAAIQQVNKVKNQGWQRAYLRLADAADCLDAMEARSIDRD